jgi:hypothetical protein
MSNRANSSRLANYPVVLKPLEAQIQHSMCILS